MTEEQAKSKYCPLIAIGGMLVADKLPPEAATQGLFCQGPACMMWRETEWCPTCKTLGDIEKHQCGNRGTGYCGLAVRP